MSTEKTDKNVQSGCAGCAVICAVIIVCLVIFFWATGPTDEELEAERRSDLESARQALGGSVFEGHIVSVDAHYGTLELTLNQEMTVVWDLSTCDVQRSNLAVLFSKWKYRYGDDAHSVVLLSYTGFPTLAFLHWT